MTQPTETTRTLVLERALPHPPAKVWRALTETPLLDEWLMKNDFQPVVGHQFKFRSEPSEYWDGIVQGEVLVVEPHDKLSYGWEALGLKSIVTWTLTPTGDGTNLRMEMAGFGPEQTYAFEGAKSGWGGMLESLAALLERA
jgi:uncharacterized protein YndB with AHSA1/START domain